VSSGARGRKGTLLPRSGGAGAPLGGIRTSRQELADGAKPFALPDARNGSVPKRAVSEGSSGGQIAAESAARLPEDAACGAPRGARAL